jgi:hypothetical protein
MDSDSIWRNRNAALLLRCIGLFDMVRHCRVVTLEDDAAVATARVCCPYCTCTLQSLFQSSSLSFALMRKESNPLSSMLLESERPERSSHAVRSRPMGTDQLRLLNTLHGKATGTQKRELRPKASLGRSDLVEVLTLYDVHSFGFAGFVTSSRCLNCTLDLSVFLLFCTLIFDLQRGQTEGIEWYCTINESAC